MNYEQLSKEMAIDYQNRVNLNQKYDLNNKKWEELYGNYINFPNVKTPSGLPYVANEFLIEDVIFRFRKLISETEHLINFDEFYPINMLASHENLLNYKENAKQIVDIDVVDFNIHYEENLKKALEFIKLNEITLENITKLYKIVSKEIIDFHPVQGNNMYRAVNLEVYNQHERLIVNCLDFRQLDVAMLDLVNLMNLNFKRDEYSNLLICCVIKYCFILNSPFYRYNEIMAELLIVWFLQKQVNHLNYFAHNNLFRFNPEQLFLGFYEARFSVKSQDISLFVYLQINMINQHLEIYKTLKTISDNGLKELEVLTKREKDYLMIIMISHLKDQYFNWEMLNDELKKCKKATTKAGVLKILNNLGEKDFLITKKVNKSKMFKLK